MGLVIVGLCKFRSRQGSWDSLPYSNIKTYSGDQFDTAGKVKVILLANIDTTHNDKRTIEIASVD